MPANLKPAQPLGVLPQTLSLAFTESRIYPMLAAQQHDGTIIRSLISDTVNPVTSIRSWKLMKRLRPDDLQELRAFYESMRGPLKPFFFYDPYDPDPSAFFDVTGDSEVGRVTCRFTNSQWVETTGIATSDVAIEFAECA